MWSPSKAANLRLTKRQSGVRSVLNLWPFVGILLALLSMFMTLTAPTHPHTVADLAVSKFGISQPHALREDAMRLAITRDGAVYFRNNKTVPEQLPEAIRGAVKNGAERKVYLQIDSRARYGDSEAVLDRIREAGIRDICLIVEKRGR